ncbi:MAG: transcription antiterminator [Alkalibacterium sp.]|nr:transcription antiterminator [Alkalibacterium sp.]
MDTRIDSILRELMGADHPLTGNDLANTLEVSSRTIREDIKSLNDHLHGQGAAIQSKRGTGYSLVVTDTALFHTFLNELIETDDAQEAMPTTPDSRIYYMLKRLLLSEGYIKLDDLADEMHVSKSTLQTDLKALRSIFEKHNLIIDSKPGHGMTLCGTELNKRFAMSEYLFNRNSTSPDLVWMDQLAHIVNLSNEKLNDVWMALLDQLRDNQVTLSDIAINNLFVHISIAYKRIVEGHHVDLIPQEIKDIETKKEFKVAQTIISEIEQTLDVTFPKVEIIYIAIHLLGTKLIHEKQFQDQDVHQIMDASITTLTDKMLEAVESKYALGIKEDKELKLGLALHLKPAINRYKFKMNIRNPMLEAIKHNYPLAFEAGIIASLVLDEELGVSIDENEVAYLALHIGAAIERQKVSSRPKTCYIVCASGVGSAQLIRYRVEAEFRSLIKVLGVSEFYKVRDIPFEKTDFIISSVPIKETLPVPIIEVNAILGNKDLVKIDQFVSSRDEKVLDYLPEENLFLKQSFTSKTEVIAFLAAHASSIDTLPEQYTQLIHDREAIAPTAYGNLIAVPHPISPQSSHTFLTMCTLKKAIDWGERKVQFVCLLNVKKDSQENLQDMYDLLGRIVNDSSLIQKLLTAKTYQEFITYLTHH